MTNKYFLLTLLLCLPLLVYMAHAEEIASIDEIESIYLTCDYTLLPVGEDVVWTVHLDGAELEEYTVEWFLGWRGIDDNGNEYLVSPGGYITGETMTMQCSQEGRYFILLTITDKAGSSMEVYANYFSTAGDGASALQQKMEEIRQLCIDDGAVDDSAAAKFMHDYLIEHAEYDEEAPRRYDAEGVLLDGRGICQSYAYAYQMLLNQMDVENMLITGYYLGEEHIWNLVRLDGNWYHVDCTADDPIDGDERSNYFLIPDNLCDKDHSWNASAYPSCVEGNQIQVDFTFENEAEFEEHVSKLAAKDIFSFSVLYKGDDQQFSAAKLQIFVRNWILTYGSPYGARGASAIWTLCEDPYFHYYVEISRETDDDISDKYDYVIGDFGYNEKDGEITIVRYLGQDAQVTVPSHIGDYPVTHIGGHAFADITSIRSITLPDSIVSLDDGTDGSYFVYNGELHGAFSGCTSLTAIEIPGSCKHIGEYAFMDCVSLTDVKLNEGVETLRIGAFENCSSLSELTLPSTTKNVGQNVLWKTNVRELYLPASVVDFHSVFSSDTLENVHVDPENQIYKSVDGVVFTEQGAVLWYYPGGKRDHVYQLPEGCTRIESFALEMATNIEEITLPSTLKHVEYDVWWPSSVKKINLAEGNTELVLVDGVLYSADMSTLVWFPAAMPVETYVMPDSVREIRSFSFRCLKHVKSITLNRFVSCERGEIDWCEALEEIIYPIDGNQEKIFCMQFCEKLKHVQLPAGLKVIPNNTFSGCTALESIELPDTLEMIDVYAFANTALKTLTIPPSVETIGVEAVSGGSQILVFLPRMPEYISSDSFARDAVLVSSDPAVKEYAEQVGLIWLNDIFLPGDVDDNETTDIEDVLLVMQYVAGEVVDINLNAADVHHNGNVDLWDVLLLMQHTAGWEDVLPAWSSMLPIE